MRRSSDSDDSETNSTSLVTLVPWRMSMGRGQTRKAPQGPARPRKIFTSGQRKVYRSPPHLGSQDGTTSLVRPSDVDYDPTQMYKWVAWWSTHLINILYSPKCLEPRKSVKWRFQPKKKTQGSQGSPHVQTTGLSKRAWCRASSIRKPLDSAATLAWRL